MYEKYYLYKTNCKKTFEIFEALAAQLAGALEYTDCISVEE